MPDTAPGAAAPPPSGTKPAQPPFGSSPATGPTPNRGYEAAAMQRLGLVVKQLQDLLPLAGVASDLGKDVLKALNMFVKHVPAGAASPAAEKNNIESMAMRNAQQGMASRQMAEQRAKAMQGAGGAAGGSQQMAA